MRPPIPHRDPTVITRARDERRPRPVDHIGPAPLLRLRPPRPQPFGVIGGRYRLINEIGQGAMGSVFRVVDRLTGRVVTLKRITVAVATGTERSFDSSSGDRTALAQEFRLAAALRHPNIVSVLDYGFDDDRQPYFTMDLEENARTIIEAGTDRPLAVQVELLVQTLRAIVYLHRQGIIHRDLKPENIVVVGDRVKVLDFGLSIDRHTAGAADVEFAGTVSYMAPELLRGEPPSERTDLYAIGMIAYELFAGGYPFERDERLPLRISRTELPRAKDNVDPRVRPIVALLLAKDPAARYDDASEVITAFATALELPLLVETTATRESFLHTAPLVGRDHEVAVLLEAIRETTRGSGGTWLVGGESGVGKSRLLDEIRTRGLVEGLLVVRGHAVSQGGGPYHVWRDILSNLILRVELNDAEAEILKAVVPEIGGLLGREIGDAPAIDSQAAQSRLLLAVEEVFRLQPGPVLVILEDLHWVGSESLKLFAWMAEPATTLPVLVIGSFRNHEASEVPSTLKESKLLELGRLDTEAITALGESLIGPVARRRDLVEFLERESEGIPFFIIEVVRALAEISGQLTRITGASLPSRVISGGMQKLVRRRLSQVPRTALGPLKVAAVLGREVDLTLMRSIDPQLAAEEWATTCARAGVLELRDQRWRFSHDKLREQILEDLSPVARRELHRQVAMAIESTYVEGNEDVTALAHHWRQAGEPAREAEYAYEAGLLALRSGACLEAVGYLRRSLELLLVSAGGSEPTAVPAHPGPSWPSSLAGRRASRQPDFAEFRLAMVESGLSEAFYRLGDLAACREHSEQALRYFGEYVPSGRVRWLSAAIRQAALRCVQTVVPVRIEETAHARRVAIAIARVQLRLTDTFFYSLLFAPLVWSSLRTVNRCEPAGDSAELAQGYVILALLAGTVPLPSLADRWSREALRIAESTGTERNVAWILSRVAVHDITRCRWFDCDARVVRAAEIAERVGDLRLREECHGELGIMALYTGQPERALAAFREAEQVGRRSGNRQVECWALLGQGDVMVRRGAHADAIALLERASERVDETAMKSEAIWTLGVLALARLRSGDAQAAYEMADRALWHVTTTRPLVYWTQQGMAAIAEVFATLTESGFAPTVAIRVALPSRVAGAVSCLRRYARHFDHARPAAALWAGLAAWTRGRPRRAMRLWRKAIARADQLRMPYESARARLELARHLPAEAHGRRHLLDEAVAIFERLGSEYDLVRARAALAPHGDTAPTRTA